MRFGICTEGLRKKVNLQEILEKTDYDFVELKVAEIRPEESEEKFRSIKEKIKGSPVAPEIFNCFIPKEIKVVGDKIDSSRLRNYLKVSIRRIASLGGKVIVFGSGGARRVPENFSFEKAYQQLIDFLNLTADIAKNEGMTIAIEPLFRPACNIINSVKEGVQLTKDAGRDEIRLLADLFHMEEESEPFANLLEAKNCLVHVHIPVQVTEGVKLPAIEGVQLKKQSYDHRTFFRYLKEINYQGRITIEDNGGGFEDIEKEAPLLLSRLKEMWQKA